MSTADLSPPRLVGSVTWAGPTVAELFADGSWRVARMDWERSDVAENLSGWYADWDHGPADGHYGYGILQDLATRMDGTFTFHQPPPAGPGVVN